MCAKKQIDAESLGIVTRVIFYMARMLTRAVLCVNMK